MGPLLGASPGILSKRNITKSTMKVGEQITVSGSYNLSRNEIAPYYFMTADGHKHEMGFYPPTMTPRRSRASASGRLQTIDSRDDSNTGARLLRRIRRENLFTHIGASNALSRHG